MKLRENIIAVISVLVLSSASAQEAQVNLSDYSLSNLTKELSLRERQALLNALAASPLSKDLNLNGKQLFLPKLPFNIAKSKHAGVHSGSDCRIYDESLPAAENPSDQLKGVSTQAISNNLQERTKTITGPDDRKDLFEIIEKAKQFESSGVENPIEKIFLQKAISVGCLVDDSNLAKLPNGDYILRTINYKEAYGLCKSERFNNQPIVSFCTAFLTNQSQVTTAAHCVPKSDEELKNLRLVFGYSLETGDIPLNFLIKSKDVYPVVKVVNVHFTEDAADWAVLQIDRPCLDRPPLALGDGNPTLGSLVYTIGHPCGLPLKIADNAKVRVRMETQNPCFRATLDTYGGNSGSPVFNAATHKVEGILVRGGKDFKLIKKDGCNVSVVTNDQYKGEAVCSISVVKYGNQ
ncbi:MAG: serine protease [Verrucomicrobiota bacterium]